jgi:hypothetical protein
MQFWVLLQKIFEKRENFNGKVAPFNKKFFNIKFKTTKIV